MGLIKHISHLKLATKHSLELAKYFTDSFLFRNSSSEKHILLQSDKLELLIEQRHNRFIDSVYDVALDVQDVDEVLDRCNHLNVDIIDKASIYENRNGIVKYAKIKSVIGNVVHTLIDSSNFNGSFVKQFYQTHTTNASDIQTESFIKKLDHITFAVHKNQSNSVIKWYSDLFDMKRLRVNVDEDLSTGFIVKHKDKGMILKAFDYWKCSVNVIEDPMGSCKFTIAEPLVENVPNQISTFLIDHEGPGVQHLGFLVDDILSAAKYCVEVGNTQFMTPPNTYYQILSKKPHIPQLNLPLKELSKYGVLIDVEKQLQQNSDSSNDREQEIQHYLMQVFTKPIFDRKTFFLELIERRGAMGFGAANIKALWEACETEYMEEQERLKSKLS